MGAASHMWCCRCLCVPGCDFPPRVLLRVGMMALKFFGRHDAGSRLAKSLPKGRLAALQVTNLGPPEAAHRFTKHLRTLALMGLTDLDVSGECRHSAEAIQLLLPATVPHVSTACGTLLTIGAPRMLCAVGVCVCAATPGTRLGDEVMSEMLDSIKPSLELVSLDISVSTPYHTPQHTCERVSASWLEASSSSNAACRYIVSSRGY
eukprot:COSAG06_NODE_3078_length_5888_cov_24.975643_6_plen_206_part_00